MPESTAIATLDPLSKPMGFKFISLGELTKEQIDVLKSTVAKGTSDTELTYFLQVAFSQELDPFKKEVWCIKMGDRLTIQTGRDGFLKVAKRDPSFDRIQSCEIREGDHFMMDPISGSIEHRFGPKRGQIIGAYAVITRKDGTKLSKYVTFSEYNDPASNIWRDYPTAMITKCVESLICKQFANVTGIVAEETMRKDGAIIDSSPSAQEQQSSLKDRLIQQIQACTTLPEFTELRDVIAGSVGKLFGPEKDAVFAAAKAKKAELETLDVLPVDAKPATPERATVILNINDHGSKEIKKAEGEQYVGDIQAGDVVKGPSPDDPMPESEFDGWIEGMRAQETEAGVDDVYNQALTKPLSPIQRGLLDTVRESCRKQLEKPKAKKKAA